MSASKRKPKFKAGQWVYLPIGPNRIKARVLEDWGTLGVDGERVYSILIPESEDSEAVERDAAESHLIPAA